MMYGSHCILIALRSEKAVMRRCALLTMDNLDGYICDDYLLIQPLKKTGWQIETISWHKQDVDWNQFDVVVIRSTWDYVFHLDDYLTFLNVMIILLPILQKDCM